ncbi:ABC transporter ATP-binding protein [Microbacterium sp. zg.Y1090]|uniref:dipeptide ABC transporter ATP-binding protein n=1 Tax=Microbacterium wangruii TaxID=3049073 RepID=UPI00214BADAE|nr:MULTISPECIES: ABC transporter ATP-binding protein [unclassified Microbacterium]MCR2817805.1 ABC transporter ATP-binding protein [Microbacterium sp. zg.Y1090]MDL5485551.1 ABC transporter ATP-binding protein [Microbacterium sp. zg-Y1211]WIM28722.1 ABC transporter ATP-binding protein [Microbacterium sp. zg-Y1090]
MAREVLQVSGLDVSYDVAGDAVTVLRGVDVALGPGEVLAVVGESGSGKTTLAQAATGLLAANGRVTAGRVTLGDLDVTGWTDRQFRSVRGTRIGWIPQDPHSSLNPVARIGDSVAEVLRVHRWKDEAARRRRVVELLDRVGIPEPDLRARQYPHELSGGMKQRALIAAAIALQPALLIADEATSALDVTVQKTILDLIDDLRREHGTAVLMVTHDLAVAADRSHRIAVLQGGRLQEAGDTARVLQDPQSAYTRRLLADAPSFDTAVRPARERVDGAVGAVGAAEARMETEAPAITVTGLSQHFPRGRRREPLRAVDDVSFTVARGTTHAIVGESGSGKTTLARIVMGFQRPTAGSAVVAGHEVARLRRADAAAFRRDVQMVYQNPFASLDPRQSVGAIVAEPLRNYGVGDRAERARRVADMLERVALPPDLAARRPRELSGGQRQRVAIARALVLEPRVVVLDEAVSALDVTVQAQILRLLDELQQDLGVTYLFISHDLAVVRRISDTVSVLRAGRIVESGTTERIFTDPQTEDTARLLAAIPGGIRQPAPPPAAVPREGVPA